MITDNFLLKYQIFLSTKDKNKVGVMAKMDLLKPFCRYDYRRHQNLPNLFRDEWKRDNIIFDLLTVIILFTPRGGMLEYEKVRYVRVHFFGLLALP